MSLVTTHLAINNSKAFIHGMIWNPST